MKKLSLLSLVFAFSTNCMEFPLAELRAAAEKREVEWQQSLPKTLIQLLEYENDADKILAAIKCDIDISATDINGNTPFHYLFAQVDNNLAWLHCAQALIERGANINAQNCAGQTPLHLLRHGIVFAREFIGTYHADPKIKDREGKTAFEVIFPRIKHDDGFPYVKVIADWPVDAYDSEGYTILHRMCMCNANWRNARYFLLEGADPNALTQNHLRRTALHLACVHYPAFHSTDHNGPLISVLKAAGADSSIRDAHGKTAFDLLAEASECAALLQEAGNGRIKNELGAGAALVLELAPNIPQQVKKEALHIAIKKGHTEFVRFMFDHVRVPKERYTLNPLHALAKCSVMRKDEKDTFLHHITTCIKLALAAGADINAQEPIELFTPFLYAIAEDNHTVARALLEYGADPCIVAKKGNTAMHLCKAGGKVDELLLEHGFRIDAKNNTGEMPVLDGEHIIRKKLNQALKHKDLNKIRACLDKGCWRFCKGIIPFLSINDTSAECLEIIHCLLTHPLPGNWVTEKKLTQLKACWFTFLCINNRLEKHRRLLRDPKAIIRKMVFPPAHKLIEMVPTHKLKYYLPFYSKQEILNALIARHKAFASECLLLPIVQERFFKKISAEQHIETELMPAIQENYEKML